MFPIGPYIHYASIPKDVNLPKIKERYGKTLIAFPMHSTEEVKCEYDIQNFIENINSVKEKYGFHSVLICMYYKDILLKRDAPYIDSGFKVISAGYKNDPYFLSRLKTFLTISDHVITNDLGTHVGYAVYMKKPVFITYQNREYIGRDQKELEDNAPLTYNESTVKEREEVLSQLFARLILNLMNRKLRFVIDTGDSIMFYHPAK